MRHKCMHTAHDGQQNEYKAVAEPWARKTQTTCEEERIAGFSRRRLKLEIQETNMGDAAGNCTCPVGKCD